jgi:hypothetical protein
MRARPSRSSPSAFCRNGATDRCHPGFGDTGRQWIAHSAKGWMTGELLIVVLGWIRELPRFADRSQIAVVIDRQPGHMTADVAMPAHRMSMEPPLFPPAARGRWQPMHVRVSGVIKLAERAL